MPALVAGIHAFSVVQIGKDVDGRDKSGHDVREGVIPGRRYTASKARVNALMAPDPESRNKGRTCL